MQYDRPPSLDVALAANASEIQAEFRGLIELLARPSRGHNCVFCDYGATSVADRSRIIFETSDCLLVDRPYAFDQAVNLVKLKNTGMSFLHLLVLPKRHISCAVTIPDPAMVGKMQDVFKFYLARHGQVMTETVALSPDQSVQIQQSAGILALIKRERAKLSNHLAQSSVQQDLQRKGLTSTDIIRHFASHAEALSGKTVTDADFATYFHVPPSIWHLHMHVALRDAHYREHSIEFLDVHSMAAEAVKGVIVHMRKAKVVAKEKS